MARTTTKLMGPGRPARASRRASERLGGVRVAEERHRVALRVRLREEQRRREQVRSFAAFVRGWAAEADDDDDPGRSGAWDICEPGDHLQWAPYLDLLCRELEWVTADETRQAGGRRELVIAIPPGAGKSILTSGLLQAWLWLRRPDERVIAIANVQDLATRDSQRVRRVVKSEWYGELVQAAARLYGFEPFEIAPGDDTKVNFHTTARGFRQCVGIDGAITGKRSHGQIVDDAMDAKEVLFGEPGAIAQRCRAVVDTYDKALASRLPDDGSGWRVAVGQRLHRHDLPGTLIERGTRHVVLPIRFEPDHPHRHPEDRRRPGEPLNPSRHTDATIAMLERSLGEHAAAQLYQRPGAMQGTLFQRERVGRYAWSTAHAPWDEVAISVDATFDKTDGSDRVAIGVWGRRGSLFFLLDAVARQMTYPESRDEIRRMVERHPAATMVLIERKANGPALISELRGFIRCAVVGYTPTIGKSGRAQVVAPLWIAGQVFVPDWTAPDAPAWAVDYIGEMADFPGGDRDDLVDMTTQLLLYWTQPEGEEDRVDRAKRFGAFL